MKNDQRVPSVPYILLCAMCHAMCQLLALAEFTALLCGMQTHATGAARHAAVVASSCAAAG